MAISNLECPNCGANILYHIGTQSFRCDSCGSNLSFAELDEMLSDDRNAAMWEMAETQTEVAARTATSRWQEGEEYQDQVAYNECPNCGAEVVSEQGTAAAFCAFCGGHMVLADRMIHDNQAPRRVLPFKITKEEARRIYLQKIKRKMFLPRHMKKEEYLENFQSMYVPFSLFSSECSGTLTAKCDKVETWSDSDYDYTKTDTYEAKRAGSLRFADMPFDAAEIMDSRLMHAIEPFSMDEITDFSFLYLSGHSVATPDTAREELLERYDRKAGEATERQLASTLSGYSAVRTTAQAHALSDVESEYVVFPVWLLTGQHKGTTYRCVINGQTGKVAGEFPISWARVGAFFSKLFLSAFVGLSLVMGVIAWVTEVL